jgi:ABC-type polysaccharide/polyol phosphate transport system ATPase subunit
VADIARELVTRRRGPAVLRPAEFWALRDVSLRVHRGESLGVMGVNGAGKSTLLKTMMGTLRLSEGRTTVDGRLAVLSEHGLGLDPALTGRENAYLTAAVLGVERGRALASFDEIVSFAGLQEFIDSPVRFYSSGMRTRLAFAVAMHLEPDALLVDEVLTVGDIGFQRRCIDHTKRFLAGGGSLVLVSHNPHLVQTMCDRCVVLEGGAVVFDGDVVHGVARYLEAVRAAPDGLLGLDPAVLEAARRAPPRAPASPASDSGPDAQDHRVVIEDFGIEPLGAGPLCTGDPARIYVRYRSALDLPVRWAFSILTADLETTIACDGPLGSFVLPGGTGALTGTVPRLPLSGGRYALRAVIMDPQTELPFSLRGFQEPPRFFEVQMPTSRRNNYRMITNDLVALEGLVWDRSPARTDVS